MTKEERKRLTPYEIDALNQITHREQPTCPGCGDIMTLDAGQFQDEWFVSYECTNFNVCGGWRTKIYHGHGVVVCAENAYKTAMRRVSHD